MGFGSDWEGIEGAWCWVVRGGWDAVKWGEVVVVVVGATWME